MYVCVYHDKPGIEDVTHKVAKLSQFENRFKWLTNFSMTRSLLAIELRVKRLPKSEKGFSKIIRMETDQFNK